MDTEKRIQELRKLIDTWNREYHSDDASTVTDAEFDHHYRELISLESSHPELVTADSPTQKVGSVPDTKFLRVLHSKPMLSLGNVFNPTALREWYGTVVEASKKLGIKGKPHLICETKMDGLAVSLTYIKGELSLGVTRGDGVYGEVITDNVREVTGIPSKLSGVYPPLLEVRGEVFMPRLALTTYNAKATAEGGKLLANCRNAAAGGLRQNNPEKVRERGLMFMVYGLEDTTLAHKSQLEKMMYAQQLGFPYFNFALVSDLEGLEQQYNHLIKSREKLPYDIDGMVIKADSLAVQEEMGFRSREPRWATAYKFEALTNESQLLDVIWQVGRTGQVTPVAKIAPIPLCGVVVSSVTLHNYNEIVRLGLAIGDTVEVARAGDVIPKIIQVVKPGTDRTEITKLTKCPECNSKLITVGKAELLCCTGDWDCPAQQQRRFEHFCGRTAFNIMGLGGAELGVMITHGLIHRPSDLYALSFEDLLKLPNTGVTSANNTLKAIASSRKQPLAKVIYALGIPEVGVGGAKRLSQVFTSVDDLIIASREQLVAIRDIGEETAECILTYFSNPDNLKIVSDLIKVIEIEKPSIQMNNSLAGQTWVITGTFPDYSRDDLKSILESFGATVSNNISAKTTCLVAGTGGGSKLDKAIKLGVRVIPWEELSVLLATLKAKLV